MKVYGPYKRKDGRSIVIYYDGTSRVTQSYPRYLMERKLARKLSESEQVDHINNDPTDNRIENLQILTQLENSRKSVKPAKIFRFICPICGSPSEKFLRNVKGNRKQGKRGPFCSRQCAGIDSSPA